jgi:phosphoribosylglycinamide formyltransferase-1
VTLRAAVFASGAGSNFQVLTEHALTLSRTSDPSSDDTPNHLWRVVLLITDRDGIFALDRARALGVDTAIIPPSSDTSEFGNRLLEALEEAEIDMVLNAGYLRLIPLAVVNRYEGRMLNLHPALLPSFGGKGMYGRRVHEAVLEAGVRLTGVTVHFVNEEYDRGRILAQWPVPVLAGDTPETLAERIHAVEHRLYPLAADRLARAIQDGSDPVPIPAREREFQLVRDGFQQADHPLMEHP